MKLKYYINENKEKIYTLKSKHKDKQTIEAHYKFIKFKESKEQQ